MNCVPTEPQSESSVPSGAQRAWSREAESMVNLAKPCFLDLGWLPSRIACQERKACALTSCPRTKGQRRDNKVPGLRLPGAQQRAGRWAHPLVSPEAPRGRHRCQGLPAAPHLAGNVPASPSAPCDVRITPLVWGVTPACTWLTCSLGKPLPLPMQPFLSGPPADRSVQASGEPSPSQTA